MNKNLILVLVLSVAIFSLFQIETKAQTEADDIEDCTKKGQLNCCGNGTQDLGESCDPGGEFDNKFGSIGGDRSTDDGSDAFNEFGEEPYDSDDDLVENTTESRQCGCTVTQGHIYAGCLGNCQCPKPYRVCSYLKFNAGQGGKQGGPGLIEGLVPPNVVPPAPSEPPRDPLIVPPEVINPTRSPRPLPNPGPNIIENPNRPPPGNPGFTLPFENPNPP